MPDTAIPPTILLLDPDRALRLVLAQALGRAGYQVRAAATPANLLTFLEDSEGNLLVADHTALRTGDLRGRIASLRPDLGILCVGAPQPGPDDLPKPFDLPRLLARVAERLSTTGPRPTDAGRAPPSAALTGTSPAIEELRQGIARLASSVLPLMLLGERGSGRTMVVRVLHAAGPRSGGPLVMADAARIPPEAQVAWLSGERTPHRGQGIGQGTSQGLFARAAFGTLYLAGIETLSAEAQSLLFGVLQDRSNPPDFRLLASADTDLVARIRTGAFRADLYYRLDTLRLRVPPLRERREDVAPLAAHFWQTAHVGSQTAVTDGARALLGAQDWPGNLDALKALLHAIAEGRRELVLDEAMVRAALPDPAASASASASASAASSPATPAETLQSAIARHVEHYLAAQDLAQASEGRLHEDVIAEVEKPLIAGVLAATGGNQIRAAGLLGINRNTLRKRIRELEISPRALRPARIRTRRDPEAT